MVNLVGRWHEDTVRYPQQYSNRFNDILRVYCDENCHSIVSLCTSVSRSMTGEGQRLVAWFIVA